MAPLENITNKKRKFDLHVRLHEDYAACRGAYRNDVDKRTMETFRGEGRKNVDLWVDGSMYPNDPLTRMPPTFQTLTTFMSFVGDGNNGLLGYCKRLCLYRQETQELQGVQVQLQQAQLTLQAMQHQHYQSFQHIALVLQQDDILKKEVEALRNNKDSLLQDIVLEKQACEVLREENNTLREKNKIVQQENKKLQQQNKILPRLKRDIEKLQVTVKSFKDTPMGCKLRKKSLLPMKTLSFHGGARKRRVKATRYFYFGICTLFDTFSCNCIAMSSYN